MSNNEKLFIGFAAVVVALVGTMFYLLMFQDSETDGVQDPFQDSEMFSEDRSVHEGEADLQNRIRSSSNDTKSIEDNPDPDRHTEQIAPTSIDVNRYGQIVGRVMNEEKRPVSHARVILYRERKSTRRVDDLDESPAIEAIDTLTDFEGNYFFSNVTAPARYELMAEAEGYACINRPAIEAFPKKTQTASDLIVGKGWEVMGSVRDAKGRAIEGAGVFLELDSGDPRILDWLNDATGNAAPDKNGSGDEQENKERKLFTKTVLKRSRTETDDQGRFDLGMVAAGTYRVGAMAEGYSMVINKNVVTEESTRNTGMVVDLVLEPAKAIRGLVVDTTQTPIEGVELCAERDKDRSVFSMARARSAKSTGQFALSGLHPGKYIISARKKGYLPSFATNVEAGTHNVTLVMPKAATYSGKVIASDTGKPVTRFSVAICTKPHNTGLELRDTIRPWESFESRDGTFQLEGLQRGHYVLVARAEGYGMGQSDPIALEDSEDGGPITIRLPEGYALKGHVESLLGAPIQGAHVAMVNPNQGTGGLSRILGAPTLFPEEKNTSIFPSAETDSQGEFLIPNALQGLYSLKITHPDYEELVVTDVNVEMKKVNYAGRMAMAQGCTLECTVFSRWGKPVPNAVMMVKGEGPHDFYLVHTNDAGIFKIINLAQGEYQISLRSGGSNPIKSNASEKAARSEDVQVFLSEGQKAVTEFHMK
ncbi:MAG: carboxypeptidase-like regulatory domain-containing protein [Planctomycetota bacterium]